MSGALTAPEAGRPDDSSGPRSPRGQPLRPPGPCQDAVSRGPAVDEISAVPGDQVGAPSVELAFRVGELCATCGGWDRGRQFLGEEIPVRTSDASGDERPGRVAIVPRCRNRVAERPPG